MEAVRNYYVPDSLLAYVVGDRCPCGVAGCKLRNYQASMLFGVIRIMLGRN